MHTSPVSVVVINRIVLNLSIVLQVVLLASGGWALLQSYWNPTYPESNAPYVPSEPAGELWFYLMLVQVLK